MPTRPPISVRRPARSADPSAGPPTPVAHSPIPNIDPDAAEAVAFSMRGRAARLEGAAAAPAPPPSALSAAEPPRADPGAPHVATAQSASASDCPQPLTERQMNDSESAVLGLGLGADLVSVKLPPDIGRQLAAIADRRGSKRTLVAIEALSAPLRALADAHRAGGFPELPKVVSGTVRSSIAFALPPDLAADLDYVLRARRAVRAQVVTRLLAPAVGALYEAEVTGRRSPRGEE
jgi:hypothetical protein